MEAPYNPPFQNSLDIEKALSHATGRSHPRHRHHDHGLQVVQVRDGRIKIMAYVSIVVLTLLLLVIVVVVLTMFFHAHPFGGDGIQEDN